MIHALFTTVPWALRATDFTHDDTLHFDSMSEEHFVPIMSGVYRDVSKFGGNVLSQLIC